MILGIVGHAQEKFTKETELKARMAIEEAIRRHGATVISSGHSPMGGVDIYAEEAALDLKLPMQIYAPTVNRWEGTGGFRERNLMIATNSDLVLCVVVKELPPGYKGMKFSGCYHCNKRNPEHVKSGGCWTAWKCKQREWVII